MDREPLLAILILLVAGPVVWMCGGILRFREVHDPSPSGQEREATAWRQLWLPLIPSALLIIALFGWALSEPDDAEAMGVPWMLLALPVAFVWLRAFVRALIALRAPRGNAMALTVGMVRPAVFIDPKLVGTLDEEALHAVTLHEMAHARHRDPFRIWLAQIATDLQYPLPSARQRLVHWQHALELARDDEARMHGASGPALADAIVTCAKMGGTPGTASAALTGASLRIAERVRRLVSSELPPSMNGRRSPKHILSLLVMAGAFFVMGGAFGEDLVGGLLGVLR